MNTYKRHRFPPVIISYAVCLYYRFNLSHRDIEDLLAQRGITVSREAIRLWYPPKVGALGEALAALMGQALHQIRCHIHSPIEEKAQRLWRYVLHR